MTTLSSASWLPWLTLVGWFAALGGLVFAAWWALFADRARGRLRCPRCWYDMTYTPGMTCGECGKTVRSEKALKRTRPRWTVAALAILGCTGLGLYGIDSVNTKGWLTFLPTRALVWVLPVADGRASMGVFEEFNRRVRLGRVSESQWIGLLERCAVGDGGARPPSDAWAVKYGEYVTTWADRTVPGVEDEEGLRERVRAVLMTIPPRISLDARDRWPSDVGPTLSVTARDWWPGAVQWRIRAQPDVSGAAPDVHVLLENPIQRRSYSIALPPLPPGEHEVAVKLDYERRPNADEPWERAGSQVARLDLEVEGVIDDHLTPVTDPALDEPMRRAFSQGLTQWSRGSLPVRVGIGARETFTEDFDDMVVAVRIDVLRNGEPGRQLDIWWIAGEGGLARQYAWEVPWLSDEVLSPRSKRDERWELRVRGLPELAMRIEGVERYWAGEFTVPVRVVRQGGRAPSRGWIPGDDPVVDRDTQRESTE
jgi:hypothetical protein